MTDGEALIRTVLANPADDAPRLVYADWLEESGRPEDAEFIRVQIELARLGFSGGFHKDEAGRLRHVPAHVQQLTERQLELWFAGCGRPDLPDEMMNWPMTVHPTPGQNLLIRRGFVERITIFTELFLQMVSGLFSRQPVTHVRLVDKEPISDDNGFWWIDEEYSNALRLCEVPLQLWPLLAEGHVGGRVFATADEADAALSWACVRYGRAVAGVSNESEARP